MTDKYTPGDRVLYRCLTCTILEATIDRSAEPWRTTYRIRTDGGRIISRVTEADLVPIQGRLL